MSRRVSAPVLVGRDRELDELVAALADAQSGAGGLVVVEGEAGIGKSRLVSELATRADATGADVRTTACLPFAESLPFAPVAALLDSFAIGPGDVGLTEVTADPGDRFRFFRCVADRLLSECAERPMVLVIEDVHWIDESTGDLLLFVAEAARSARLLVVATTRPAEPGAPGPLGALAELIRSGRARRVALGALAADEVTELVTSILGIAPTPGLLERVAGRADGNPYFVEELVAAGGAADLPASVGEVVMRRVERLDATTRAVLGAAAVIGRRVNSELLRQVVADRAREALDGALREAIRHQLLVTTDDDVAFRHALGHEAVYRSLLPTERRALHGRVAEVLAARPDLAVGRGEALEAAELAHHWERAGRPTETLAASVRAGSAAERTHAPAEAQQHYCRALDLWSHVDDAAQVAGTDHVELLQRAADAASLGGDHEAAVRLAEQLLDELEGDRDQELFERIRGRRALYLWYAGDAERSRRSTEQLRTVDAGDAGDGGELSASAVARWAGVAHQLALELRYLDALPIARNAVDGARQLGDRAGLAYPLHVLGSLEGHLGRHHDAVSHLEESLAISLQHRDQERIGATWHNLSEAHSFAGRHDDAASTARAAVEELRNLGLDRTYVGFNAGRVTAALTALGRWDDADRVSAEALHGDPQPYLVLPAKTARLHLLTRQGRFDEAEALAAEIGDQFGDYAYMTALIGLARAEIATWRSEWPAARAALERVGGVVARTDDVIVALRSAELAVRVEADAETGARLTATAAHRVAARAAADRCIEQVRDLLRRVEDAVGCCSLPLHAHLSVVAAERTRLDDEPPAPPWSRVAEHAESDPYLVAYARWREAEAVLGSTPRFDRTRAEELLRAAWTAADELGAAPLAGAIADLARRARVALDAIRPDDAVDGEEPAEGLAALGLTARELEVLELLGAGLSNREIGEALFISAKTASVHVTHILQKLNVTTRVQAAVAAGRLASAARGGANAGGE